MFPINLKIGEFIEFEVTYFPHNNDTEHRSVIQVYSDGDDSGNSGKYNSTITLLGNAESSSVKNIKTQSNFFPNPSTNTITFNEKIRGIVEIYNLFGDKVAVFNVNSKSTFDISNLSNGTYIIKYKINNQLYSEKLSITK
jgi:hypothetical protein